jgi:hypothetical protein
MLDSNTIYLTAIEAWRDKVLLDLLLRKFRIQQLEAVALYEKARAGNLCQQQVNNYRDVVAQPGATNRQWTCILGAVRCVL